MTDKTTKFIKSLDNKTKERLKEKLIALKRSPYLKKDIKKLRGAENDVYRLRMGKIRIIYKLVKSDIEIIDIDYRGNIY